MANKQRANNQRISSVELLPGELKRRFKSPMKSITFWMHLGVAVIGFGGAGIWYSLFECISAAKWSWTSIAAALCTYFPAVAGAAYIDSSSETQPYFRSFGIIVIAVFVLLTLASVLTVKNGAIIWGMLGSIFSILFWWVVNADKECFHDVNGDGPTPDPNQNLRGSQEGWRTS